MTFKATITGSSRELTPRERVAYKDTALCERLDEIVPDPGAGELTICPVGYYTLEIHNERAKDGNVDYNQLVVIADDGRRYLTGSTSFETSFLDIWDEMGGQDETDPWKIAVYKKASKNRAGKYFISASLIF